MFGIDWHELIKSIGYAGLFVIIFSESGLLVGIMLPGDSLLITAGILASQGVFNPVVLALVCVTAAISGDAAGYAFGKRVGRRLYQRPNSRFFKQKHLEAAEAFYERHGGKAIVLARFVPFVRTLAPIVAGMAQMRYRRFALFNAAGGVLWGAGVTTAGYLLGSAIEGVDKYLIPLIAVVVALSLLPSVWHIYKENREEIHARIRRRSLRQATAGNRHQEAFVASERARGDEPVDSGTGR